MCERIKGTKANTKQNSSIKTSCYVTCRSKDNMSSCFWCVSIACSHKYCAYTCELLNVDMVPTYGNVLLEYLQSWSDTYVTSMIGYLNTMSVHIYTLGGCLCTWMQYGSPHTTPVGGKIIHSWGKQIERWVKHYYELYLCKNKVSETAFYAVECLPTMEELTRNQQLKILKGHQWLSISHSSL